MANYASGAVDTKTSVFQIQETWRRLNAMSMKQSESVARATTGWCALDDIHSWLLSTTTDASADPLIQRFIDYVKETIKDINETTHKNVRAEVIAIWTWPRSVGLPKSKRAYLDFVEWKSPTTIVNEYLKTAKSSVQLVDGKIYFQIEGGLRAKIWSECARYGINLAKLVPHCPSMIPNPEPEHITLMNSDVVARLNLPPAEWERILKVLNSQPASAVISCLKHTASLDYAPIAVCLVAGLEIVFPDSVQIAIQELSKLCAGTGGGASKSVFNCSQHLTLAVLPR